MFAYLILRDNKQSGPFSLEELKSFGIRATDLLWIEGRSTGWHFPDEIEELQAFVHVSPINGRFSADAAIDIEHQEERNNSFSHTNRNENHEVLPIERKIRPSYELEKDNEQISKRSLQIRKAILAQKEQNPGTTETKKSDPATVTPSTVIKVVIADDHLLFREGVKTALAQKSDVRVVAEAENGMQLLNLLRHSRPDVILLDIQMPLMDGVSALGSIRKLYTDIKVIVLSMHEGHSMVSTMMEAGANGYLTKTADPETIYQAIKTCYEKNYYFNELTNVSMLEGLRSKKRIPEKIVPTSFNGAEMMLKLTAAQKKSRSYSSARSQKRVLVAMFSVLLIGAGVLAGISIMGKSAETVSSPPLIKNVGVHTHSNSQPSSPVSQSSGLSQKQAEDSLQKQIDKELLPEKNILTEKKNDAAEKHATKKSKDSSKTQLNTSIQKIDSAIHEDKAVITKPAPSAVADDAKTLARSGIHNLVTTSVNDYHKGAFGGLSEIEITVNNRSGYTIDEAIVEVQYYLSNSKLYKTETISFHNISPSSSQMQQAPKSSRGTTIEYKIVSIRSKELEL